MAGPLRKRGAIFLSRHNSAYRIQCPVRVMHDLMDSHRLRDSAFRPPRWLRGRHLQTIYPSLPFARAPQPLVTSEQLELPDGDVTTVDWLPVEPGSDLHNRPLLVILHGLEGSARSSYCRQMLQTAADRDWRAAVLHFRDCGDFRNRLPRRYHAGETDDLRFFLDRLRHQGHRGPIYAVGYSLGGNVLLKYLGESGSASPVSAAVAVSVPLNLHICAAALTQGFSRVYQSYLLRRMKRSVQRKFNPDTAAFDWHRAMAAATFAEFDDTVTAPLHGFVDKDDYYDQCSAAGYLNQIQRPVLIISALDDPFMTPAVIPAASDLPDTVTVEISAHGGHVGFIDGGPPWRPHYFLPGRIAKFLDSVMVDDADDG